MEEVYKQVEELIEFIKKEMKEMYLNAEKVFLNGNCGNLYMIFAKQFPKYTTPYLISYKGVPYHMVSRIGERFYDITGETSLDKYSDKMAELNKYMKVDKNDFDIRQLSVADDIIRFKRMCNMYRYNDDYEQSEIENEMNALLRKIEKRNSRER